MEKEISKKGLLAEFPPVSKEVWMTKVKEDLKGQDFEKRLVYQAIEGFKVAPFYTAEDSANPLIKTYENSGNPIPEIPGLGYRHWNNTVKITDVNPNKEALAVLNAGAEALVFEVTEQTDVTTLLKDVLLAYCPVWFEVKGDILKFAEKLSAYFAASETAASDIKGGLILDPLMQQAKGSSLAIELKDLFEILGSYSSFKVLTIDIAAYHNAGATAVQELGFGLAQLVQYMDDLTEAGLSSKDIAEKVAFNMASGGNYFMEIAKFKAMRILAHQIFAAYQAGLKPEDIWINAETSYWTKSLFDSYNNMLRNTTEAMAAILGGANAVLVHPHDQVLGLPSTFSKRISRNVSTILREESYLDKVMDPTAGTYLLEQLIDSLVKNAWQLFEEVEAGGGWLEHWSSGKIMAAIANTRAEKHFKIHLRKDSVIGANQYPSMNESISEKEVNADFGQNQYLTAARATAYLEHLRMQSTQQTLKVHLLLMGQGPMVKARAGFATNFFESMGVKVTLGKDGLDLSKASQEAKSANVDLIVLCGADETYQSDALSVLETLKDSKAKICLAGNLPDLKGSLEDKGLYRFIHRDTDVVTFGQELLSELSYEA